MYRLGTNSEQPNQLPPGVSLVAVSSSMAILLGTIRRQGAYPPICVPLSGRMLPPGVQLDHRASPSGDQGFQ